MPRTVNTDKIYEANRMCVCVFAKMRQWGEEKGVFFKPLSLPLNGADYKCTCTRIEFIPLFNYFVAQFPNKRTSKQMAQQHKMITTTTYLVREICVLISSSSSLLLSLSSSSSCFPLSTYAPVKLWAFAYGKHGYVSTKKRNWCGEFLIHVSKSLLVLKI